MPIYFIYGEAPAAAALSEPPEPGRAVIDTFNEAARAAMAEHRRDMDALFAAEPMLLYGGMLGGGMPVPRLLPAESAPLTASVLRQARTDARLSQSAVAKAGGFTQGYITQVETGRRAVTEAVRQAYEKAGVRL